METTGPYVRAAQHPNPKCIIFSIIMIALYWVTPEEKNIFLTPVIFIAAYVAMGWYDHVYDCDRTLLSGSGYPGAATYDSIFKPQKIRKDRIDPTEEENLLPGDEQRKVYLRNVYLFHVTVMMPLLIYIGVRGKESDPRAFGALLGVSVLGFIYHLFRLFYPRI